MNTNNVALGRVTRKRMHEYYKNFVSDPDIFMDMSKYYEYQYSPERIDRYWETRKKPKDRKDSLALAYAFENLGMESVLADSVLKNTRSQHVLEKVGFVQIGADDTFKYYHCDKNSFKKCT